MRITLVSPPYVKDYMRNARCDFISLSGTQWYPIWLAYCGAWLEKCGHEVVFIDAQARNLSFEETERLVVNSRPHWVIFYTGRLSEDSDIRFADRMTDKLACKSVLVGPYASIFPEQTLAKAQTVKYLVTGEFEQPVAELCEAVVTDNIQNLVYKKDGKIIRNPERPYLSGSQLDEFPFVSKFFKKHLDVSTYKSVSEHYPYIDIMTGRGCQWGRCTYCLWVHSYIKGPVYNCRSIPNVIEELKFIAAEMPEIKSVMIQDDTFTEERAKEFCEAKISAGITLPFSCYARGNMSRDTLRLMKQANVLNLHVGFESADNQILGRIKKGVSKEQMTQFALDAHAEGIRIHGDFAIGFPGETRETALETIKWACEIRPHTAQFQLMIPFPGTPFFDELSKNGWLKNGYPDYPQLSASEMESLSKQGYRKFYISWPFVSQAFSDPKEMILDRFSTYLKALPSVFWKRYVR